MTRRGVFFFVPIVEWREIQVRHDSSLPCMVRFNKKGDEERIHAMSKADENGEILERGVGLTMTKRPRTAKIKAKVVDSRDDSNVLGKFSAEVKYNNKEKARMGFKRLIVGIISNAVALRELGVRLCHVPYNTKFYDGNGFDESENMVEARFDLTDVGGLQTASINTLRSTEDIDESTKVLHISATFE